MATIMRDCWINVQYLCKSSTKEREIWVLATGDFISTPCLANGTRLSVYLERNEYNE